MKKFIRVLAAVFCLVLLLTPAVSAASPYQTHTYAAQGRTPLNSPDAYTPVQSVDYAYMGLSAQFGDVSDMFVDENDNVYLVDSKGGKVIVLDKYYKYKFSISSFVNDQGVKDSFTEPKGVFVKGDTIYVCDTNANRIVIFDIKGNFQRIVEKPQSKLFGEDAIYKPIAMVVDNYGRFYVISSTTYQGVIVMTSDGTFTGFIGAQKVTYDALDLIWSRFQTAEQRKQNIQYVPTEYNNITIDADGFIYVTSSSISESNQKKSITAKNGTYSPVKMLNTAGKEVMKRTGFYDPGGEVYFQYAGHTGASKIVDVALGEEGTWTIIDSVRSKSYTYDSSGNLLFAFGDAGKQLGNLTTVKAVQYQGSKLLILDSSSKAFTVYKRTEYGDVIISALANENNREYSKAVEFWQEILMRNSNFDAAYIGIGQALYREADYKGAMEMYKSAYDTENYSSAYKEVRKEWISQYILLIPIIVIAVCILVVKFNKFSAKYNKQVSLKVGKRTFMQEFMYLFHLIFHPFDGFWDLKHEKRGSVRAGLVILVITIAAMFYQSIGRGYVVNPFGNYSTIIGVITSLITPVALWIVANWCVTTLFDGEGSFKDILVATCYSLAPLPLFLIISTMASNIILQSEASIVNLVVTIGYIWVGYLLFFGTMVTHDYTLGKNFLTMIVSIVGMGFIMFIGILFTSLLSKMISFVMNIVIELAYRV